VLLETSQGHGLLTNRAIFLFCQIGTPSRRAPDGPEHVYQVLVRFFEVEIEAALRGESLLASFDALPDYSVGLKLMLPPFVSAVIATCCVNMWLSQRSSSAYTYSLSAVVQVSKVQQYGCRSR
jgi:hypothetical protein